jgi:hypothetical protein
VTVVFAGKEQSRSRPHCHCNDGRSKPHKINVDLVALHSGVLMADNLHKITV